jgi:hypothetical protein
MVQHTLQHAHKLILLLIQILFLLPHLFLYMFFFAPISVLLMLSSHLVHKMNV